MNSRFDFNNGLEMVITDDGFLPQDGLRNSARQPGHVGVQLRKREVAPVGEPGEWEVAAQFFLPPSHARAVASAMLSAANAARDR